MPAPPDNTNARIHGCRSERALVLSDTPKGSGHIKRDATNLRRKLEAAATAVHGELTLALESLINLACRNEVKALLAAKWLRDPTAKLTPNEKLGMINAVSEATAARDNAIRQLKLNAAPAPEADDPWEAAIAKADALPNRLNGTPAANAADPATTQHNANGAA